MTFYISKVTFPDLIICDKKIYPCQIFWTEFTFLTFITLISGEAWGMPMLLCESTGW